MASLNALKQDKADAEKDLKKYKKRLKEVRQTHTDLRNADVDYCDDINYKLDSARSNLAFGIRFDTHVELGHPISVIQHKDKDDDSNLIESIGALKQEITRIENKIETLNSEIKKLDGKMDDAESNQ